MDKVATLFSDLKYYAKQVKSCGESLVLVSEVKGGGREVSKFESGLIRSYTLMAKYYIQTAKAIRKVLAHGKYRSNPYELNLHKMEHLFRMARERAETARTHANKIWRSKGKGAKAALAVFRAFEKDAMDAANAAAIVAEKLGKRTPEWERKLGIDQWLG